MFNRKAGYASLVAPPKRQIVDFPVQIILWHDWFPWKLNIEKQSVNMLILWILNSCWGVDICKTFIEIIVFLIFCAFNLHICSVLLSETPWNLSVLGSTVEYMYIILFLEIHYARACTQAHTHTHTWNNTCFSISLKLKLNNGCFKQVCSSRYTYSDCKNNT